MKFHNASQRREIPRYIMPGLSRYLEASESRERQHWSEIIIFLLLLKPTINLVMYYVLHIYIYTIREIYIILPAGLPYYGANKIQLDKFQPSARGHIWW